MRIALDCQDKEKIKPLIHKFSEISAANEFVFKLTNVEEADVIIYLFEANKKVSFDDQMKTDSDLNRSKKIFKVVDLDDSTNSRNLTNIIHLLRVV